MDRIRCWRGRGVEPSFLRPRMNSGLIGIQLYVERGEQRRPAGIIAHQRDEIDQSAAARRPKCCNARAKLAEAISLAPKISRPKSITTASAWSRPLVSRRRPMISMSSRGYPRGALGFVRCPFESAVELTGRWLGWPVHERVCRSGPNRGSGEIRRTTLIWPQKLNPRVPIGRRSGPPSRPPILPLLVSA